MVAAFGFGLFGLIFSLLPSVLYYSVLLRLADALTLRPKLKKIIAWFGFGNSNRAIALKLLTVAALTGNDVHGSVRLSSMQWDQSLTNPFSDSSPRSLSSRTTASFSS